MASSSRRSRTVLLSLFVLLMTFTLYVDLILRSPIVYSPPRPSTNVQQVASVNLRFISSRPAPLRALKKQTHTYRVIKKTKSIGTLRYFEIKDDLEELKTLRPAIVKTKTRRSHDLRFDENESSISKALYRFKPGGVLMRRKRHEGLHTLRQSRGISISPHNTAVNLHTGRVKRFFILPLIIPIPRSSTSKQRHQSKETQQRREGREVDSTWDDAHTHAPHEKDLWKRDLGQYRLEKTAPFLSGDSSLPTPTVYKNTKNHNNGVMNQRLFLSKMVGNSEVDGMNVKSENIIKWQRGDGNDYNYSDGNLSAFNSKKPAIIDINALPLSRKRRERLWSEKDVRKAKKSGRKVDQNILYILDQIQMSKLGTKDDFASKWIDMKRRLKFLGKDMEKSRKETLTMDARLKKMVEKGDRLAEQIMKTRKRDKNNEKFQDKLLKKYNVIEDNFKKEMAKHEKEAQEMQEEFMKKNSLGKLNRVGETLDKQEAKMRGAQKLNDFFALHGISAPMERNSSGHDTQNKSLWLFENARNFNGSGRSGGIGKGILDDHWQTMSKPTKEDPDLVHVSEMLDKILMSRNARETNSSRNKSRQVMNSEQKVRRVQQNKLSAGIAHGRGMQWGSENLILCDNCNGQLQKERMMRKPATAPIIFHKEAKDYALMTPFNARTLANIGGSRRKGKYVDVSMDILSTGDFVGETRTTPVNKEGTQFNTLYEVDGGLKGTSGEAFGDRTGQKAGPLVVFREGTERMNALNNNDHKSFRGQDHYDEEIQSRNVNEERYPKSKKLSDANEQKSLTTRKGQSRQVRERHRHDDGKMQITAQGTPPILGEAVRRRPRVRSRYPRAAHKKTEKEEQFTKVEQDARDNAEIAELESTIKQAERDVSELKHVLRGMQDKLNAKRKQKEARDMQDLQRFMHALNKEIHAFGAERNRSLGLEQEMKKPPGKKNEINDTDDDMSREIKNLHEDLDADVKSMRRGHRLLATNTPNLLVHPNVAMSPDEKFINRFDTKNFTATL